MLMREPDTLLFLLPEGKAPFMGIIHAYPDGYQLQKQFLSTDPKELYIYFVANNRINIRVQLTNLNVVQFHSQLEYDRTEFLLWLDSIKDSKNIVFGHLMKKDSKPEMIREPKSQQPFYFTVNRLFIVDFKDDLVLRFLR
jgi:hypothetical protein